MSNQERSEHARHEFSYYSSDVKKGLHDVQKALNLEGRSETVNTVLGVFANVVALPFAARAYLMNDGMYRTATKADGSPAYVVPPKAVNDEKPKGPTLAP
jgi:hypothetical protein